jgi:hypothetical protein
LDYIPSFITTALSNDHGLLVYPVFYSLLMYPYHELLTITKWREGPTGPLKTHSVSCVSISCQPYKPVDPT